ncbi:vesicle-associated membrane protein-associated protein C16G5.05c-like [Dendrobium catenatum]|uniref:vesicle-associated membrane protein-associated protein C16G5.05c-like n=1 Tax=Dendrobium catenatum TaxID=906689 RepID=UPI0010A06BB9|nr:vesicle-associated membrane protein-associated protein C16G5.05c-like [Dendrobium catenatum]
MESELLEIQPRELKFTFELKKQSSCLVRLSNKSNEYVAFKVKTTSPKRYCVRPNTGVIMPRSTCDFTVTMQAQRTAPPDMQVKDKFLVQSTIVPFGSTDEDITSTFFSKESGNFIEECKLRVVLVSPPHSPVLQPVNGTSKQEAADVSPRLKLASVLKESPVVKEASSLKDEFFDDKNFNPSPVKEVEDLKSKITILESKLSEAENVEDLKSKINTLHSKLSEADKVIAILEEETGDIRDRDISRQNLFLRRRAASRFRRSHLFWSSLVLFYVIMDLPDPDMTNGQSASQAAPVSSSTPVVGSYTLSQFAILVAQMMSETQCKASTVRSGIFLRLKPLRFEGTVEPIVAKEWLRRLEKTFDDMQCPSDRNVPLAVFLLDGEAERWWMGQ